MKIMRWIQGFVWNTKKSVEIRNIAKVKPIVSHVLPNDDYVGMDM